MKGFLITLPLTLLLCKFVVGDITDQDYSDTDVRDIALVDVASVSEPRDDLIDMVNLGKNTMDAEGCMECHSVVKGDLSVKTGPNLYGLFQPEPIRHKVVDPGEKETVALAADFLYFQDSLANPDNYLAIQAQEKGSDLAYPPVMPPYSKDILSAEEVRAVYDYLLTLNSKENAGPATRFVEPGKAPPYNPDTAPDSINARNTTLVYRAYVNNGTSARGIQVGQTNLQNFTFDPSTFAIDAIWTGRFLDIRKEIEGRGGTAISIGVGAQAWPSSYSSILRPLTVSGKPFSAVLTNSYSDNMQTDELAFEEQLKSFTGKLIGYTTDDKPTISYTLDGNHVNLSFTIDTDGSLNATLSGELKQPLTLTFPTDALKDIQVSAGRIDRRRGTWTLSSLVTPVSWKATPTSRQAGQDNGKVLPQIGASPFAWVPSENDQQDIISGYSLSEAKGPVYTSGSVPLFEPLAIEFDADGTPVIASRAAGIWKIKDAKWQPYALGLYDVLGLKILPDGDLIVAQKPEITRISDKNKDGNADHFQTLTDQFRFAGNYHAFTHGPAIDKEGNIHFNLNLQHMSPKHGYKAGGQFMASSGGYRGWSMQYTPDGKTIPFANGLRSPAGLAFSPDDKLYCTENQGEYVGTSKLFRIKKGQFYGHPSSLIDEKGQTAKSINKRRKELVESSQKAIVLFPQKRVANSPGNPVWDTTHGKFGPFTGQIFVGDQTLSNIHRLFLETVNGIEQGAIMPFVSGLESGPMRLTFSPDGEMWVGQSGRGWASKGGHLSALQKITWDGSNSQAIHRIEARPDGFEIYFTQPIPPADQSTFAKATIESWYYENSKTYGSEEYDKRKHEIEATKWSADGQSVKLGIKDFTELPLQPSPSSSARLYRLSLKDTALGASLSEFQSTAYYTLNAIPK